MTPPDFNLRSNRSCMLLIPVTFLLWSAELVMAEETGPVKHDRVITGILATTGRFSLGAEISIPTVGTSPGDERSIFSGSIGLVRDGLCRAIVHNDGEGEYDVTINVIGSDGQGKKVYSREAHGKVKPKATLVRDVTGCKREYNLALELRSAKPVVRR